MEQFGKYELVRRIGSGGMAEVFLARTAVAQGLSKTLVIKKIHPAFAKSPQFTTMFVDEAKIALTLNHPNIVQVFDFGTAGGVFFLAMELIDGMDLLSLARKTSAAKLTFPFELSAYIVQQLAKGLDYAHRKTDEYGDPLAIVHRDVSPQNVLVSWDGAVKLVDFGIAHARTIKEEEGVVKGKFGYMSQEQARGYPVDCRSDVFSAGVVLFELACGRPLYSGKGNEVLEKARNGALPRPRDINKELPEELEQIIMRSLAFHADDRFQTARDLQRALGKFQLENAMAQHAFGDSASLAQFLSGLVPPKKRTRSALPEGPVAARIPAEMVTPPPTPAVSRQRNNVFVVTADLRGRGTPPPPLWEGLKAMAVDLAFKHQMVVHRAEANTLELIAGIPVTSDDDNTRAIRVAQALTEALSGLAQDVEFPVELRIGIQRTAAVVERNSGSGGEHRCELQDGARKIGTHIAAQARNGRIVVDAAIVRVSKDEWNFEPANTTDPGSNNSPKLYELVGIKPRAQRQRERESSQKLVGRELELKALVDTFRTVQVERTVRQSIVVGDGGIGKRALINEFLSSIAGGEAVVFRTVARRAMSHTPLSVVAELTREYLGITDDATTDDISARIDRVVALVYPSEDDARIRRRLRQTIGLMFGAALEPDLQVDAGERKHCLTDALLRIERLLPPSMPLVFVGEECQWADADSLGLLVETLGRPVDRGILVVLTTRPEGSFISNIGEHDADVIRLGELGGEGRLELFTNKFVPGQNVSKLASLVLSRTGGNPFFICETLDALTERGIVRPHPETGLLEWIKRDDRIDLPTSVDAVLSSRIDQRPHQQRDILVHAAVLGRRFTEAEISVSLGHSVSPELAALIKSGLLVKASDTHFAFSSEMAMEVAHSRLPRDEQARLHRLAAKRIEEAENYRSGQDDAVIARHLELAGAPSRAAEKYLSAGVHATSVGANSEAHRLLTRTLKLAADTDFKMHLDAHKQREEILNRLSRKPAQLREIHSSAKVAVNLGDAIEVAAAHARLCQFYIDVGKTDSASKVLPVLSRAAQAAGDKLSRAEELRLRATIARLTGDAERAIELSREALTLCGTARDALQQRGLILNNLGTTLWNMGHLERASEAYAECLVIYRKLPIPRLEARILNNMAILFHALGEFEEALAHFKSSLKISQALGDRVSTATRLGNIGQTYSDVGDVDTGLRYLKKALALTQKLDARSTEADVCVSLSQCYLELGHADRAVTIVRRGLQLATETADRYQEVRARIYTGLAELRAGHSAAGALEWARSATEIAERMPMLIGEVHGLAIQGLALGKLGRAKEGAALARSAAHKQRGQEQLQGQEVIWLYYGLLAEQADALPDARNAIDNAYRLVEQRMRRLHDEALRSAYWQSGTACQIREARLRLNQPESAV